MTLFSKKKNSFSYLFFTFVQNFKPKNKDIFSWHVYLNVLNHIVTFWKKTWIFAWWGALIIFGKGSSVLSLVGYGLVTKTFRVGCTFKVVVDKTKCQKMNVIPLRTKLGWIIHLVSLGQNPLKLLYFIMIFNTISMPYKVGPTNYMTMDVTIPY
jgi:hypothetical protein